MAESVDSGTEGSAAEFWENRYAETPGVWSGRVNAVVREVANSLTPGDALDLGCGEGGDAIWLAQNGWTVTGVDLSQTAVTRARAAADAAGVTPSTLKLLAADLAQWESPQEFDFVVSAFLHSWPVAIPRDALLKRSKRLVAPGGVLLILAHAEAPPWADPSFRAQARFPTPEQDLANLDLDSSWVTERCGIYEREATGPGGRQGTLRDSVVVVRRL